MSPTIFHHDYYAILEIPLTADFESIRSNYKRLAKIRHPDKNPTTDTTAQFQLLHEAHSILSDPATRQRYDAQYQSTKSSFGGTSSQTHHSTKESEAREDSKKQRIAELETKLKQLNNTWERQQEDLSVVLEVLTRLNAEAFTLEAEINDIMKQQAAKETWMGYFSSFIPGRSSEVEGQKRQRDRDRLQKIAAQRIKQNLIVRQREKFESYQKAIFSTNKAISSIKSAIMKEKDKIRMKQEETLRQFFRKTAEEADRRQENWAKESKKAEKQKDTCRHQGWWNRTEGRAVCSRCSTICRRFAFRCPGCDKTACAPCRTALKKSGDYRPHTSTARNAYDR